MKERNFYNDEFEELLRQKTDQYKMYPSDKVWKNVDNALHTKRRWFFIGMSFLITGILFFAGKELLVPTKHLAEQKKLSDNSAIAIESESTPGANSSAASETAMLPELKKENLIQQLSPVLKNKLINNEFIESTGNNVGEDPAVPGVAADSSVVNEVTATAGVVNSTDELKPQVFVSAGNITRIADHNADPSVAVNEIKNDKAGLKAQKVKSLTDINAEKDRKQDLWLEGYALQQLTPVKKHKLNWQVYFSPTVNYRKLSGGDNFINIKTNVQNIPIALNHFGNPNSFVNHKPAIGFEVGGSMMYRLTRNLTFKAGVQFNYSRYTIRAYSSAPEEATIALSNSSSGYPMNSITSYTDVRNFGGNSQEDLQNQYFQLSSPIGLEMKILGNGRLQLNIAGTVQPTYLLNRNTFLLTADYTNYAKEPSLIRKWNINTGVEAFISYKIGSFRWQMGPQFRYQVFSTYTNAYPLKENLMEYGIKIGVSKTIR